mmetsp:Transcript_86435/g.225518  ORF Transcript_86435/g.225518 Transcript_86435/m.225518 type:complete len:262 (-) Transcript_86435:15-800(-)
MGRCSAAQATRRPAPEREASNLLFGRRQLPRPTASLVQIRREEQLLSDKHYHVGSQRNQADRGNRHVHLAVPDHVAEHPLHVGLHRGAKPHVAEAEYHDEEHDEGNQCWKPSMKAQWVLSDEHQLQAHHEDDARERGDGGDPEVGRLGLDHIVDVGVEDRVRNGPADDAMIAREDHPFGKHLDVEQLAGRSDLVQGWVFVRLFVGDVFVKGEYEQHVQRCEDWVEVDGQPLRNCDQALEFILKHPHNVQHDQCNVLVQEKA